MDLTKEPCLKDGTGYKSGVKVKDKNHHRAINRVKEKLLKKQFQKFPEKDIELTEFLSEEKDFYEKQLEEIYDQIEEDVEFTVSDMLRGKCMFEKVEHINQAAESIINKAN